MIHKHQEITEQDAQQFHQYTWLFYALLQGADFALLQLQDNRISKGHTKHQIGKDRRTLKNILNRLGHKGKKAEGLASESVAFMAQCMLYISSAEEEKLEWIAEEVFKVCVRSKNIKLTEKHQDNG